MVHPYFGDSAGMIRQPAEGKAPLNRVGDRWRVFFGGSSDHYGNDRGDPAGVMIYRAGKLVQTGKSVQNDNDCVARKNGPAVGHGMRSARELVTWTLGRSG